MTKEEKLTQQVVALKEAIKVFVRDAPSFENDGPKCKAIAVALANVEGTLHWEFGCWELALPE